MNFLVKTHYILQVVHSASTDVTCIYGSMYTFPPFSSAMLSFPCMTMIHVVVLLVDIDGFLSTPKCYRVVENVRREGVSFKSRLPIPILGFHRMRHGLKGTNAYNSIYELSG